MRAGARALLLAIVIPAPAMVQAHEKVIDVRSARVAVGNTFEGLMAAYRKADRAGDTETSNKILREIRRLRIERNIRNLEGPALGLVDRGLELLAAGERDRAEEELRGALGLDPNLPDIYFALARTEAKQTALGPLAAAKDVVGGLAAPLRTIRGRHFLQALGISSVLLALLGSVSALAFALLVANGGLLRHDLEESFGGGGRAFAFGLFALLVLLPVVAFQGYGWLPFWWLALLFGYLSGVEKVVAAAALVAGLAVGPLAGSLEDQSLQAQNPLFRAGALSIEGAADSRATSEIESAVAANADDRDLSFLLAAQYKKAGRYDDAAAVYKDLLKKEPNDPIALNNLGNLEFASGEFQAAIARYKQGAEAAAPPEVGATFYYNLEKAHLQRFEYQPAQEARSQADRLNVSLTRYYDNLWKYDKGENAVVDLGLTSEQLEAKFVGVRHGIARKNVVGGGPLPAGGNVAARMLNRFGAFLLVAGALNFGLGRWRGPRAYTTRCVKCGTPFCKRCHLGAASEGLCTQCHHLFLVRDGVSGPARNQKLLEVQKEDERRERIFRVMSLLSPGAGHVYARKTIVGFGLLFLWYLVLAQVLLAGRVLPVTEVPSQLTGSWALGVAGVLLLALYVLANRARPDFEVTMPIRRLAPLRARRAS